MDSLDRSEAPDRLLRIGDVLNLIPVSRQTLYRLVDRGEFPKPVKLGSTSAWVEREITDWQAAKIASR